MRARLQVDAEGFRQAIRALTTVTGQSVRHVIRAEAGSILKACAADTKVAPIRAIDVRERLRALRDLGYGRQSTVVRINAGLRGPYGRVWRQTGLHRADGRRGVQQTHESVFRPLWRHFGDAAWAEIQTAISRFRAAIRERIPAARRSQGLSRQSWVQIADSVGIRLEAVPGGRISPAGIAKARAALASTGVHYVNGQAKEYADNKLFVLELINSLPWGLRIKLDSVLSRNLNGRVRFYQENLRRGVFDRISAVARAYPGLRVRSN